MPQNLQILVVEDNPGDYVLIQEYLLEGLEGAEIHWAKTYSEFEDIIQTQANLDCILLDLTLPDVSGAYLVQKVLTAANDCPVVVLTGYENQEFGLKTVTWGVSDYLLKDECNAFLLSKVVNYSIERNRIQQSLKKSELQYRNTFNLSPQPMYLVDMKTYRFVDVNEAAIDQYGYSKEEFLSMTLADIRTKDDVSELMEKIKEADESSSIFYETLLRHRKKSGQTIIVKVKTSRLDENGQQLRMVLAEDVTEQKYYNDLEKLEREILEKNALNEFNIKKLIDEFVLGIEKLHLGTRCSVTKIINNRLKNYSSPSLPREYLDKIDGIEIGLNKGSCATAAYLKEQVIVENIFKDKRWKNYKHLGKEYNFSACWSNPVFNNKGDVVATFAVYYEKPNVPTKLELNTVGRAAHILRILFESHEKEVAEEKLAINESKYRSIVQDGADLIAILDENGTYKYVSPNTLEVMGIPSEEFIGENVFQYLHDEDREGIEQLLGTLKPGERKHIKPYRFKLKDYGWFWIETTVTNLLNNPSIGGYLANSRDVTDQIEREKKLKELSLVASKTTDVVVITDELGYTTWVNNAFTNLTEYTQEEIVGKKPGELLQGIETDSDTARRISNAIKKQKPIDETILNYSKSGKEYWINMSIDPVVDENGICTHFIAIQRDVTEKINKERELKESLERYDIVSKATSDTIWDLNIESDRMVYNSNIYTMFGYSQSEVERLGKWWRDKIHPDDLENVLSALSGVLKLESERFQMEYRFKAADGSYKYIYDRAFVLKDEEGKPVRIIGAMQDVTLQMEEEEQLKLYESVVTNTQESVVILETQTATLQGRRILYVNDAFTNLTGYKKEEVLGKTLHFLNGPKTDEDVRQSLREAINRFEPIEVEFINYKKNGEEFWINTSMVPVKDGKGSYSHWVAIGRDVTARRNYEDEIQSSLTEKEMLLAEIHHRVKNNLAVISGMMQLQAFESDNLDLQEKLHDSVSRIQTMATVHELLYQTSSFSNIDFSHTVDALVTNVASTLASGSKIEVDIKSMPIMLNINQAIPVSLIINEVMTNAYKHAFKNNAGGRINIRLFENENQIDLNVSDNGIGLPENFDKKDLSTMGLKLISVLSDQINATYDYQRLARGTGFSITFKKADIKGIGNVYMV